MHAEYLQVLSCQLVVQVEIACLFIVAVNFIFLAYEKPVVVIDAADASLQQGGELLCGKVELRHSLCAKDIYFPVAVACYPGYVVAKKAVRIVLSQLVGLYVVSVIAVQSFPCAYPQNAVFIDIKAVDGEL